MQNTHRQLKYIDLREDLYSGTYKILGMVHWAFVTSAGLLIMFVALFQAYGQVDREAVFLPLFVLYVTFDLARVRFPKGATISLGFPIVFLALLADSPTASLVIAALGSLISETLHSKIFSKQSLPWSSTFRRALFYAAHHSIAAQGALITYSLIFQFPSPLETIHILGALAYVIVYSLVSMFLVWPHDLIIRLMLAHDEQMFVRVHILLTLSFIPFPAFIFYFVTSATGQVSAERIPIVSGIFLLVFVILFLLARSFVRTSDEQERSTLKERAEQLIGSPTSLAEMIRQMLESIGTFVGYRWGAVYSLANGELVLKQRHVERLGERGANQGLDNDSVAETPSHDNETDQDDVRWPEQIKPGAGVLGRLATEDSRPRFFYHGFAPATQLDSYLYLPRRTALIVVPITAKPEEEGDGPSQVIGAIILARTKKLYTDRDRILGQALNSAAGNLFLSLQYSERKVQEIYRKVRGYTQNQKAVEEKIGEIISNEVSPDDLDRLLAAASERVLDKDLQHVLQSVIEEDAASGMPLTVDDLSEIFAQIQREKAISTISDSHPQKLTLLYELTRSLSPAVGFQGGSANVLENSSFKLFCRFLLKALKAVTIQDIAKLAPAIDFMMEHHEDLPLASHVLIRDSLVPLRQVASLLDRAQYTVVDKLTYLQQAWDWSAAAHRAAQNKLQGPERVPLVKVAGHWKEVIDNDLNTIETRRTIEWETRLNNNRVWPLPEVNIELGLTNRGPGIALSVVVELLDSEYYEVVGSRQFDLGSVPTDSRQILDFRVRPSHGHDTLLLRFSIEYYAQERSMIEWFSDRILLQKEPVPFSIINRVYVAGPALGTGSSLFYGREDVFSFIRHNVADPGTARPILLLVGNRRMGKTSILKQLPKALQHEPYVYVQLDCQGITGGIADFFYKFSDAISEGLNRVGLSVGYLSPVDFKDHPQYVFEKEFLPEVWGCIGDRYLLITIDEFDALYGLAQMGQMESVAFSYLRYLMQSQERMAFVLVLTPETQDVIANQESALLNLTRSMQVSFLDAGSAAQLIVDPVARWDMVYDDLALNEIFYLTGLHPYFLQMLCSILVDLCNEQKCNYVTIQHVRDARDRMLNQSEFQLKNVWEQTSSTEQAVWSAVANLPSLRREVTIAEIVEYLNGSAEVLGNRQSLDVRAVGEALEQLVRREIVFSPRVVGSQPYFKFTAGLYRLWVTRHKPYDGVSSG